MNFNVNLDNFKPFLNDVVNNNYNKIFKLIKENEIELVLLTHDYLTPRVVNKIKETLKAFPGANELHPDAFGALVSLVFNRGAAVTGKNREEMKNIRSYC